MILAKTRGSSKEGVLSEQATYTMVWSKEALDVFVEMFNDVPGPKGTRLQLVLEDYGRGRVGFTVTEIPEPPAPIQRSPKRARKGKENAKARP